MTEIFNSSQEFSDFVARDDTHMAVMHDVLSTLNPSAPPAPGPLVADQLLKMLNWTRATTTFLVTKYDRSGHLEHGPARLRDIYDNFCQGPQCPEPIDRPKAACYMFAALGIVFNEVNCCALFRFIFIDTFTTEQSSRLVESSFAQGRKMHPWSGRRIRTTGRGQWAKGNSNSSTP
jgi:hypothetical protein